MEIGSADWCTAMSEVLADVELPKVRATVEQRITDGNGGPSVAYRLVIDGGRAHLEPVDGTNAGSRTDSSARSAGGRTSSGASSTSDDSATTAGSATGLTGADVVMSQSRATAQAVRSGELGALAALQAGLIKVSGDVRVLIVAAEALAAVDAALGAALGATDGNGRSHSADDGS